MPPLDNAKHERFAQALAAGKTAVGAYEAAGYRRNRGHASTLRKNPKLLKRVDEILETRGQIQGRGTLAAIERVRLTKTAVMEMLLEDREDARKAQQFSSSIRATELIGTELGMFIKRSDNKHSFEKRFSQMNPEQQKAVAMDVLTRARAAIERQKVIEAEAQQVKRPASDGAVSNPKPL
jgi:hypothetical protein